MSFDPKTNKFPYPIDTNKHYLKVKKNDGTVFDKDYKYIDDSKSFMLKRKLFRIPMFLIGFPVSAIRQGLIIKGRENLRIYKDVIKKGIISVYNHVHMWDYLSLMHAVFPHMPNILSWAPDISGENGKIIRLTGGIPVPENDMRASAKMVTSVKNYLNNGGWLHICAEGSMWEYYQPIRPFMPGAAYFAVKANKPILPFAYSYRKPSWIRKLFKQPAAMTLTIGEPIYKNNDLSDNDAIVDLTKRCHEAICRLAGIDPKENIYPPIFDNSKRIDYYTKEYGVGYKGSW